MTSEQNKWEEKFDSEIAPMIEHPLYEFNFTEGHTAPKKQTAQDISIIKSFTASLLQKQREEAYKEGYQEHKKMMEDRINEFGEYDAKGCLSILMQMDEPEPVEY